MSLVKDIGHLDDPEHYRAVMTGAVPVDQKDAGLMPVDVDYSVSEMYDYFDSQFEGYDTKKAADLFAGEQADNKVDI